MANDQHRLPARTAGRADIDAFLARARAPTAGPAPGTPGQLIFALDATQSRQSTWDIACHLQGEMFEEVAKVGGLEIQLVYYRGMREFQASRWVSDGKALADMMAKIDCRSGLTQIGRVLEHIRTENGRQKVQAAVFVGDAMEEAPSELYAAAAGLGVPCFIFQEGDAPIAARVFKEIARLTKGAHCRFSSGSAHELAELLRAVAAYAVGGRDALLANKTGAAAKLLLQLPPR
jgi:hypothetical protein